MKKKILALLGVAVLAFGMVACTDKTENDAGNTVIESTDDSVDNNNSADIDDENNNDTEDNLGNADNGGESVEATGAVLVYNAIWNSYNENDMFAAIGGDFSNPVDNAPGKIDTANADTLVNQFYIPEDMIGTLDDVASLMHGMNANTYTGIVAHTSQPEAFADAIKNNIMGVDWVCGFPDRLVVADLSDGYVAYAFGEASIMETYVAQLQAAYPSANIIHDINLAE